MPFSNSLLGKRKVIKQNIQTETYMNFHISIIQMSNNKKSAICVVKQHSVTKKGNTYTCYNMDEL